MQAILSLVLKFLPSVGGLVGLLVAHFSPDVQAFIATFTTHNPMLTAWIVYVFANLYHNLPGPIQGQITNPTLPDVPKVG